MGYKNRYLKEEAKEEQKYDAIHVKTIESCIENFYHCGSYSGIPLVSMVDEPGTFRIQ